ncbi:AraC family transcriptional regulator [Endozoicomonas sp.]|uniref:AraC family transcriptional regulator n=1 Tax=Endozoicomonas sp. TaxID=1892382 RepID=UPI003AF6239A
MTTTNANKTKAITVNDDATTLSSWALALVNTIKSVHCPVEPLLQEAGIDPSLLTQAGQRIPIQKMAVLWKAAVRETGNPAIGLLVSQHLQTNHLYAFSYVIQACGSVREALETMVRFSAVISTAVELELKEKKDCAELIYGVRENYPAPCHEAMDASAAITIIRAINHLGLRPEDIVCVKLPRPYPDQPELWKAGLPCPVHFDSDCLRVVFQPHVLENELPTASPEIASTNGELLRRYLDSLNRNFVTRARQHLADLFISGEATQEALAAELNMSPRNLQRKLFSEETSFRNLLDELRQKQGLHDVQHSQKPITEVAHDLGFSDTASFSRAFKRWTGTSPTQYRKMKEVVL